MWLILSRKKQFVWKKYFEMLVRIVNYHNTNFWWMYIKVQLVCVDWIRILVLLLQYNYSRQTKQLINDLELGTNKIWRGNYCHWIKITIFWIWSHFSCSILILQLSTVINIIGFPVECFLLKECIVMKMYVKWVKLFNQIYTLKVWLLFFYSFFISFFFIHHSTRHRPEENMYIYRKRMI